MKVHLLTTHKIPLLFKTLLLLFIFTTAANAGIYKWKDENGRVHFSDQKPKIHTYEDIEAQIKSSGNIYSNIVTDHQKKLSESYYDSIAKGNPDKTDLYFISFAGDAKQGVFMREALFTKQLFDTQYNTQGRSTALINHRNTTKEHLVASNENLERAIKTMGDKMDEEDIIYIYLTSHGSRDHKLSVDFPPHTVKDFGGDEVRRMLDEANIKWRVIVISACYAGGFIESLKTPHSIIATAADANNTSFGCSDDRDFTYYGEAIYKRQMAKGTGITESLDNARGIVSQMEQEKNYKSSNPQYWVGTEMTTKMEKFENGENGY